MKEKFIQIKDASKMLCVSKLTLRNWDKAGKLVAYRHPINNYRVYQSEDINKIILLMASGAKPVRPKKIKKEVIEEKPGVYKLKVIHRRD